MPSVHMVLNEYNAHYHKSISLAREIRGRSLGRVTLIRPTREINLSAIALLFTHREFSMH